MTDQQPKLPPVGHCYGCNPSACREIERLRAALTELNEVAEHLYNGGSVNRTNGWEQRWDEAMLALTKRGHDE